MTNYWTRVVLLGAALGNLFASIYIFTHIGLAKSALVLCIYILFGVIGLAQCAFLLWAFTTLREDFDD